MSLWAKCRKVGSADGDVCLWIGCALCGWGINGGEKSAVAGCVGAG